MSKNYRIGIIGVGAIAGMHARAIADIPNATLAGASCRTEKKGREFVDQFGGEWFAGYEQMLDTVKPDVVTICTPSGVHLEPTQACAQRGIHVLCEKPLEINTARIGQMNQAADQGNIKLGGIFPQRYNPVVQAVQKAAGAGRFGQLAVVSAYVPWWRDDAYYAPDRWQGTVQYDGGGAMMNQSIHGVDMLQWIAAAGGTGAVRDVFAFTGKRGHDDDVIEVEDTAVAVLRFENGALGQLLGATSMYPGSLKRFQIAGRDGTAEILEDELITYAFRDEQDGDAAIREQFGGKTATGGGAADPMAIDYSNHTRNIQAFLKTLDDGSALDIDATEASKAVAIIEAVYESARTGQCVSL